VKEAIFKDKTVIFVTTYFGQSVKENGNTIHEMTDHVLPAIHLFFQNIVPIIKARPQALMVIIDNGSAPELVKYLKTLAGSNILLHLRSDNVGRPRAINEYIAEHIGPENLPRSVWAVDPDVLFDPISFDYLAEAVPALPKLGVIGMRYKKNICNPELRTSFHSKNIVGTNGKTYNIDFPFMAKMWPAPSWP
jgi:hypothetical protein